MRPPTAKAYTAQIASSPWQPNNAAPKAGGVASTPATQLSFGPWQPPREHPRDSAPGASSALPPVPTTGAVAQ
eukprot:6785500-Prymnesium_polylepis.1